MEWHDQHAAGHSQPGPDAGGATPRDVAPTARNLLQQEGSLVTEYGLLVVVAATVAGVLIQWASGGAIVGLFNGLLEQARSIVGA